MGARISRLAVYLVLVALAVASVASGQNAVALTVAGVKTLLVGLEYMELRHAHRAHLAAFVGWTVLVSVCLILATS